MLIPEKEQLQLTTPQKKEVKSKRNTNNLFC